MGAEEAARRHSSLSLTHRQRATYNNEVDEKNHGTGEKLFATFNSRADYIIYSVYFKFRRLKSVPVFVAGRPREGGRGGERRKKKEEKNRGNRAKVGPLKFPMNAKQKPKRGRNI